MKTFRLNLLFILVGLFFIPFTLNAVPAKRTPVTITQSDGSVLTYILNGDEHFNYRTTLDGYLIEEKDGIYYYAYSNANDVIISDIKANNIDKRTKSEKDFLESLSKDNILKELKTKKKTSKYKAYQNEVKSTKSFPLEGEVKSLVILVEFKNKSFSMDDAHARFSNMLNQEGYSTNGATGSSRDYFIENSSNKFNPHFDVYGPVKLTNNYSYYGTNTSYGDDMRPEEMVIEACKALDSQINFADYDTDSDGFVDNIYVFYAGYGEADGGSSTTIWPHAWAILDGADQTVTLDGVKLNSYACSNEIEGSGDVCGIGTFTHEFCHVLGLPDLYSTVYNSAFTPGEWEILDYGPYNNKGNTPPYMSIYSRYELGWMQPEELKEPANIILNNINENVGYIIKTNKAEEYFLLENRQQKGWDQYIPGHGMLIWHIDYNQQIWVNNEVNNVESHQRVDIEEADGIQSEEDQAGDSFPGTSNKTEFTDNTSPNMKTWSGTSLNKPITNIKEDNGIISFKFMGGASLLPAPVAKEASSITSNSFTANWEPVNNATEYIIDIYTLEGNEERTVLSENFNNFSNGNANSQTGTTDVSTKLNNYTQTSGWSGSKIYEAGGSIKLGASSNALGYIETPEIDLSSNSGKFNLSFDAMAWSKDSTSIKIYLNNELVHTVRGLGNTDSYIMSPFSIDITGGVASSKIKIEGNQASKGRFFLDNLVITQGGAVQTSITGSPFTTPDTSFSVTELNNEIYYYTVKAKNDTDISNKSNVITVSLTANSINEKANDYKVYLNGNNLIIETNKDVNNLLILDISGKIVYSGNTMQNIIPLDNYKKGIYIIKIGSSSYKIIL